MLSPAPIAAQLKQRGLLPDLAGWQVIFSGLGDTAGRQPPLPLPQRTTLASYWMAICRAARRAGCQADEMTRPDPPARSKTAVPVVPVPAVESVRGPNGATGVSVPSDELFAFDSAVLLPGADGVLGPAGREGPFRAPARHHHRLRVPRRRDARVQPRAVPGPRAGRSCAPGRPRPASPGRSPGSPASARTARRRRPATSPASSTRPSARNCAASSSFSSTRLLPTS